VALPDHDGFWVCRSLKADEATKHIPVVMLTAMGLPSDREKAVAAGADGYIVKPFSTRDLAREVSQATTRGPAEREEARRAGLAAARRLSELQESQRS
jgi:CheY-like chemotaxis protein